MKKNISHIDADTQGAPLKGIRGEMITFHEDPFLVEDESKCYSHYSDGLVVIQGDKILAAGDYMEVATFYPQSHMDGFHVHQIPDLLHPLVGHAGPLLDQRLVVFNPDPSVVAEDHQIIIPSPFIWKLDVKSEIPVIHLPVINLAHVIPPGGHIFKFDRLVVPILHPELWLGPRGLSYDPAIKLYGIFPDPDHVYIMLHRLVPLPDQN